MARDGAGHVLKVSRGSVDSMAMDEHEAVVAEVPVNGSLSTSLEGRLQSVIDTVARDTRAMLEDAEREAARVRAEAGKVRAEADEYARATRRAAETAAEHLQAVQAELAGAEERCRQALRRLEDVMGQLGEEPHAVEIDAAVPDEDGAPSPEATRDLEEDQIRRPW